MDFGVILMTRGVTGAPEAMSDLGRTAERLGYGWLAVNDHLVVPGGTGSTYPYTATGEWPGAQAKVCLEVVSALAFLAARVPRVRLLTSVLVVPMRQAVLQAKQLATLDVLSGGRLTLGVGAGWLAEEFAAVGAPPFEARGKVTDEYVEAFRTLWREDEPSFAGEHVAFSDVTFLPKPVQPGGIPVWTGGESGPALRRAARLADGWYPVGSNPKAPLDSPQRYAAAVERVKAMVAEAGRDPAALDLAMMSAWPTSENPVELPAGGRAPFTGPADAILEDLAGYRAGGLKHLMLSFPGRSLEEVRDRMGWFAERIMPNVGT